MEVEEQCLIEYDHRHNRPLSYPNAFSPTTLVTRSSCTHSSNRSGSSRGDWGIGRNGQGDRSYDRGGRLSYSALYQHRGNNHQSPTGWGFHFYPLADVGSYQQHQ